jgi:hypothetical protein
MDILAGSQSKTERVLVLYSMDRMHPAHELTGQGIRSALKPVRRSLLSFFPSIRTSHVLRGRDTRKLWSGSCMTSTQLWNRISS